MKLSNSRRRQRGGTLTGYALVLSTFVSVALGTLQTFESTSSSYLADTGTSIEQPLEGREYIATSILPTPPEWAVETTTTTVPTTTTTAAPTTTTAAPTTTTAAPTTTTAAPTTTTAAPTTTTAAVFAPIYTGSFTPSNGNKCLEVQGSGQMQQNKCKNSNDQKITLSTMPPDKAIMMVNGLCLQPENNSTANGANIYAVPCNQTNQSQIWIRSGTSYVNVASGKCMDIYGASTSNGAALIQWTCHGGTNQQFNGPPNP